MWASCGWRGKRHGTPRRDPTGWFYRATVIFADAGAVRYNVRTLTPVKMSVDDACPLVHHNRRSTLICARRKGNTMGHGQSVSARAREAPEIRQMGEERHKVATGGLGLDDESVGDVRDA